MKMAAASTTKVDLNASVLLDMKSAARVSSVKTNDRKFVSRDL